MFKNIVKPKKNIGNKGFSLVEVLVAVAIISIAALPLINSFMVANTVNSKAEVKLAATSVAENAMEEAKSVNIESLVAEADGKYYINQDDVDNNGNTFNVQTIIDASEYENTNNRIWNTDVLSNEKTAIFSEPEFWKDNMVEAAQDKYLATDEYILANYMYDIEVKIEEITINSKINEQVIVSYYYYFNNTDSPSVSDSISLQAALVFDHTGDNQILENIIINYQDDSKLNSIKVYNKKNKSLSLALMENGNTKQDNLDVYELKDDTLTESALGVWKENDGFNGTYYKCDNNGETEVPGFIKELDTIVDLQNDEFIYSIEVNVYDYVNTADTAIKYNDDIKLTTLEGSKLED